MEFRRVLCRSTLQPGNPRIRVESARCKNGRTELSLTQGEFTRDRKGKAPLHWQVPVIAKIADGKESRAIVSGGKGSMTVDGCGSLVVNADQSGYRSAERRVGKECVSTGRSRCAPYA